jgi:hypothetical protein
MKSFRLAGLSFLLLSWLPFAYGQSVIMERGTGKCVTTESELSSPPRSTYKWEKDGERYQLAIATTLEETGRRWTPPESARISLRGNLLTITVGDKETEGPPCPWRVPVKLIIRGLEPDIYHLIVATQDRFFVMRHLYIDDPANIERQ